MASISHYLGQPTWPQPRHHFVLAVPSGTIVYRPIVTHPAALVTIRRSHCSFIFFFLGLKNWKKSFIPVERVALGRLDKFIFLSLTRPFLYRCVGKVFGVLGESGRSLVFVVVGREGGWWRVRVRGRTLPRVWYMCLTSTCSYPHRCGQYAMCAGERRGSRGCTCAAFNPQYSTGDLSGREPIASDMRARSSSLLSPKAMSTEDMGCMRSLRFICMLYCMAV